MATLLRRLMRVEAIKRLFRKLRALRLRGERRGVTALEIPVPPDSNPKTCTDWRVIDVPTEIVKQLQKRNQTHFGQAHGTPFTVTPLVEDLGFCGDGPGAEAILQGIYETGPFDEHVQLLLDHLRFAQTTANEPCRPTITEHEFRGKLQV